MKYAPSKWQNDLQNPRVIDLRSSAHAAHLPQDEATLAAPAPRQHNGGEEHLLERSGSQEAAAGRRGLLSQKVLQDGSEWRREEGSSRLDMLLVGAGDDFRAGRVRRGDDGDGGARLLPGFRLRPRQGDAAGGRQ